MIHRLAHFISTATALILSFGGLALRGEDLAQAALCDAVSARRLDTAESLLKAGADPNMQVEEHSLTQIVNMRGDVELFKLLQRYGGKAEDQHPATPFLLPAPAAPAEASARESRAATLLLPAPPLAARPARAGRCRLAVIADSPHAAAGDLLMARLSKMEGIELLERQELQRVLAEQQLSLQNALDPAQALRLGALLGSDALLLLRSIDVAGDEFMEARLMAVRPGVVLATQLQPQPPRDLPGWVEVTSARIAALAGKGTEPNAIAISFIGVRANIATTETLELERLISVLLAERIAREPGVVLLEREALSRLAEEKALPEEKTGPFWTASYLLDGTLDLPLDGADRATISFHLQSAGEMSTFHCEGSRKDPAGLVTSGLERLRKEVQSAKAAPPFSAKLEAQALTREAAWALAADLLPQASRAADAAWALGDRRFETARVRAESRAKGIVRWQQESMARIGSPADASPDEWGSRAPLTHPLRPPGLPAAAELLGDTAAAVHAWRQALADPAIVATDQQRRAWLELGGKLLNSAAIAIAFVDTAVEKIREAERLAILRAALAEAFDAALASAARTAGCEKLLEELAVFGCESGRIWCETEKDHRALAERILALGAPKDAFRLRAHIRVALLGAKGETGVLPSALDETATLQPFFGPDHDSVWRSMAGDLCERPEPDDVLLGAALRLIFEKEPATSRAALVRGREALWALRERLGADTETYEFLDSFVNVLSHAGASPKAESFDDFRIALFADVCARTDDLSMGLRNLIEPVRAPAENLKPARAALEAHLARPHNQRKERRQYATFWREAVPGMAPPIAVATVPPLRITRAWRLPAAGPQVRSKIARRSFTWAEDRLWFYGETEGAIHGAVYRFDPLTMQAESWLLPDWEPGYRSSGYGAFVIVTPARVFVSREGQALAVGDRATRAWQVHREINPAQWPPLLVGEDLFIQFRTGLSEGVLQFDPRAGSSGMLVSTRRTPPASPLDDPSLVISLTSITPAGEVLISAYRKPGTSPDQWRYHAWSPATRKWRVAAREEEPRLPGAWRDQRQGIAGKLHVELNRPDTMLLVRDRAGFERLAPIDWRQPDDLATPQDAVAKNSNTPPGPSEFLRLPHGLVGYESDRLDRLWFIPQAEFDAWLAAHAASAAPSGR